MNALSSKAASLRAASEAIKKVSFVYAYVLSSTFSSHASDFLRLGAYDYENCMTLRFAKHWKQEDDAPKLRRRNAMVHCDG